MICSANSLWSIQLAFWRAGYVGYLDSPDNSKFGRYYPAGQRPAANAAQLRKN